jgi:subtilisin family serine protease
MTLTAERLTAAAAAAVRLLFATAREPGRPAGFRAATARRSSTPRGPVEPLESRWLLSAALDLIGVTALRADLAFAGIDGSGVTVAVIDTGVDFSHPRLSTARVDEFDFVRDSTTVQLTDEHGTHVAGIVGARDPDIGVAPGVGLVGLQVFTKTRGGGVLAFDTDTEAALQWVADHRAQYNIVAVNLSLGGGNFTAAGPASSSILADDVQRLEAAGVTVVAAAGNAYGTLQAGGSAAPAVFSTLSVGAVYETNEGRVGGGDGTDFTTAADRLAFFSQRPDTANEVFAPGAFITSTVPGGGLRDLAGTSMASPMVAGVVALMQDAAQTYAGRLLTPAEVRTVIQQTADVVVDGDDEDTSVDTTGGSFLRVNAYEAVKFIKSTLGGTGGNPAVDPNGTIATAVVGPDLTGGPAASVSADVGTDGQTAVGAKDVDLVKFVVNGPGQVTVSLGGVGFRPALRVFDAAGTQVGVNSAPVGGAAAALTLSLAPGIYFAGVSGAPNTGYDPAVAASGTAAAGTGDYTLGFDLADNTDVDGVLSAAVPINLSDGTVAQAVDASLGNDLGGAVGGKDVDIYQIVAPDDGSLLVDVDTLSSLFADTYLRVFNAAGTEIGFSRDDLATDLAGAAVEFDPPDGLNLAGDPVVDAAGNPAGHNTDSFVKAAVVKGQTYFVAVCNFENRAFSPTSLAGRVDTGSQGTYSLFVSMVNRDLNGAIPQAAVQTALPVAGATDAIGTDRPAGDPAAAEVPVGAHDVDFFKLRSPAAGILEFNIDSLQNATDLADPVATVLRLFDAAGNMLSMVDGVAPVTGGAAGADPLLWYEVAADTDYFVAVAGAGNTTFDPFVLASGGTGDTGRYRYSINVLPPGMATALADDSAAGGQVQVLAVDTPVVGEIGVDDGFVRGPTDVDIYTFAPPATGVFTFTAAASDDFGADTFLRLFTAAGTELFQDDNSGGLTGGSRITASLTAGQTYLVGVTGAGTEADAYDPISGANAGIGSTGGYVLSAVSDPAGPLSPPPPPPPRSLAFDAKTKATYTDADGTPVTVTLKGPGTGTLEFAAAGDVDAARLVLTGTTAATTVTVKGATRVGGLTADGAIKSLAGKTLDLTGTVSLAGGVAKSLVVRGLSDAAITVGGTGLLTLTAGDVFDTTLAVPAGIKVLKVNSWTDAAGSPADTVVAPQVLSLTSAGDFGADVTASTVGTVKVGGTLRGDVRSAGSIGAVTAGAVASAAVFAGVDPAFNGRLPDAFADPAAQIKSFVVKGKFVGSFDDARVAAPAIRKAVLGDVRSVNDGVPLGVAADLIASVAGTFDGGAEAFKFKNLIEPAQSVSRSDAVIRLV